jgi:4-amino-4-deoxy-L-arabinose transferase-like glycosyltransferase
MSSKPDRTSSQKKTVKAGGEAPSKGGAKTKPAGGKVANAKDRRQRLDEWLADRHWLVIAAILALSIAFRIAYFLEAQEGPPAVQHRWNQADMFFFDRWAREIAAGDWLSREVEPPFHSWHFDAAKAYFESHPEELTRLKPLAAGKADAFFAKRPEAEATLAHQMQPKGEEYYQKHPGELAALREEIVAASLLWREWGGPLRFHQEPLYPYLVGLTYVLFGPDPQYVYLWQMLLGAISNVLVYLIARRHFGEATGLIAGLLAVLCPPLVYFEAILLRESLIVFFGLLLVWLAGEASRRGRVAGPIEQPHDEKPPLPTVAEASPKKTASQRLAADHNGWGWWLATGCVMGVSLLVKSHFAVFVLGTLILLAIQYRKAWKELVRLEAVTLLGIAIGLTPLVIRNLAVGVSPLALAGNGGVTFIHGNGNEPELGPYFVRLNDISTIMGQTHGRLLPTVIATLKTYDSCLSYGKVLWGKFQITWNWYEAPDNTSFYYYGLHCPVLRELPITFGILSPLALVGLALGLRQFKNSKATDSSAVGNCPAVHLYLLILTNLAVLLAFYVRDRYRVPLTAALIPFAALTLVQTATWFYCRERGKAGLAAASVALLACWTSWPLPQDLAMIRPADYMTGYQLYYDPMEEQAKKAGNFARAAAILADSLALEPHCVKQLGPNRPAKTPTEIALGRLFADIHDRLGEDYNLGGRRADAEREFARVKELDAACQSNAATE